MDYSTVLPKDVEIKTHHDEIDNFKAKDPPDWDKLKADYLGENEDWLKFMTTVSEDTVTALEKQWQENFDANIELIKNSGNAADLDCLHGYNNTAVVIGASPALRRNGSHLRDAHLKDGFILVAVGSALKFLLSIGVKPDYVCICDASILVKKQIEGVDTKGITLIANAWCHPEVLDCWDGKKFFVYLPLASNGDQDKKNMEKLGDCCQMSALGNVFNMSVLFAHKLLKCKNMIFVGNELTIDEKEYYADGTTPEFIAKYANLAYVTTLTGKTALTFSGFYQYKLALENMLGQLNGFFINATEDGIVGYCHRYGNLPWIKQYTLKRSIEMSKAAHHKAKLKEKEYLAKEIADDFISARKLSGCHGV